MKASGAHHGLAVLFRLQVTIAVLLGIAILGTAGYYSRTIAPDLLHTADAIERTGSATSGVAQKAEGIRSCLDGYIDGLDGLAAKLDQVPERIKPPGVKLMIDAAHGMQNYNQSMHESLTGLDQAGKDLVGTAHGLRGLSGLVYAAGVVLLLFAGMLLLNAVLLLKASRYFTPSEESDPSAPARRIPWREVQL